jgi:transcriptional regulator with XRE-family HTH domain
MTTPVLKRFAEQVKKHRLDLKLSQEELAEICGLHRTYIGMIERAEKNITLQNIEKLAEALQVEIKELL